MNSTNEAKMGMKQAKQNSTPNIRWTLVRYDLIVYALVAVILLVLYGGMDKLSTVGIFQQVGFSVLCIFTARLIGKIYGQVWRGDMVGFSVISACCLLTLSLLLRICVWNSCFQFKKLHLQDYFH
ncbi:hypothetical protein [Streptococcus gallolyticus]|uniref:hypothetical protein n=1 Tax=Streptococcus gallolyticus TaxID=315405 RepID=UPI001F06A0A1|nr:hypothetical protein [Streptococcus gallolyticus]MCH1618615.1 hypothetical protein [Streptococcus gallolyticus]